MQRRSPPRAPIAVALRAAARIAAALGALALLASLDCGRAAAQQPRSGSRAEVLLQQGLDAVASGRDAEGLAGVQEALSLYDRDRDSTGLSLALDRVGALLQDRERYEASLPFLERRLRLEQHRNPASAPCGEAVFALGNSLLSLGRVRDAEQRFNEAREIFERAGSRDGLARTWLLLGHAAYFQSRLEPALRCYDSALCIREEQRNEAGAMQLHASIGNVYMDLERTDSALAFFLHCLPYFERERNDVMVAYLTWSIGSIYGKLRQHDKAFEYSFRALEIYQRQQSWRGIANVTGFLGSYFGSIGKLDDALHYHRICLDMRERTGNRREVSRQYSTIAELLRAAHRDAEALALYRTALCMDEERGEDAWVACNLNAIGELLARRGELDSAIATCLRAYRLLQHVDPDCNRRMVTLNLSAFYERAGDTAAALRFYREHTALKDSVINEHTIRTGREMEARYRNTANALRITSLERESARKDLELEQRERELERRRLEEDRRVALIGLLQRDREIRRLEADRATREADNQRLTAEKRGKDLALLRRDRELQDARLSRETTLRNAMIAVLGLALLLGIAAFAQVREKRRAVELRATAAEYKARSAEAESLRILAESERRDKEAQQLVTRRFLEAQEQERARISGELHDSLGQQLVVVKNRALIALGSMADGPKVKKQLDLISDLTTAIMQSVREISHALRPSELDRLGLTSAIRGTLSDAAETAGLRVESDIDPVDGLFRPDEEITIYRIMQEALGNVMKHAHATASRVELKRVNGTVRILVEDNGRGFTAADAQGEPQRPETGFGLCGMEERVHMLHGTMRVESSPGHGSAVRIVLPVPKAAGTHDVTEA